MQELIKINVNDQGIKTVSARELYSFLNTTERFSSWMERQFQYGFEENVDYIGCKEFNALAKQDLLNYHLTIDTAKEIAMLQKSEKGKQARRYFIECERKLIEQNKPALPQTYATALLEAGRLALEVEQKQAEITELKPFAEFGKAISSSSASISVGAYAKMLQNASIDMGRNKLFEWMRLNGYLQSTGRDRNAPYQRYIEQGLFETTETLVNRTGGAVINITTLITGKGQKYFSDKFKQLIND